MVRSLIPTKNYRKRHYVKFYCLTLKNLKVNLNGIKNGNKQLNVITIEGKKMTYPEFFWVDRYINRILEGTTIVGTEWV